jgi:hypothetical protein
MTDRKNLIHNVSGGERYRQFVYDKNIYRPTKKQKSTYKQHDEFAAVNYFGKCSKYDLDRGQLDYKAIWKEKQARRNINAQARREAIGTAVAKERFNEVVDKVNKIRTVNAVKEN